MQEVGHTRATCFQISFICFWGVFGGILGLFWEVFGGVLGGVWGGIWGRFGGMFVVFCKDLGG